MSLDGDRSITVTTDRRIIYRVGVRSVEMKRSKLVALVAIVAIVAIVLLRKRSPEE